MKKIIGKFFANIRFQFFDAFMEWEIYNRIAAQVNGEKNHGYPFSTLKELEKCSLADTFDSAPFLQDIEKDIARMPRAYGLGFRYILHRDLKTRRSMSEARIIMYQRHARRNIYPETCDPRFVATRA